DQLGVTESRRLVGEHVLTREEMDRPHDDDVAVTGHWTKYGALYHIPYGSLLAKEYQNLLTAGRSISVDHRVHHATKEIPACMATGEAAGTAAALSLSLDAEPKRVDIAALRSRLVERGAILAVRDGAA
ncbi:MAG: FAD-dependent oxidoreductase, partial [Dehalococcoidia bacterium]|nr:FAD-dependent oxidoreductase [Dehalococcoidia bacterium]